MDDTPNDPYERMYPETDGYFVHPETGHRWQVVGAAETDPELPEGYERITRAEFLAAEPVDAAPEGDPEA